MESLTSALDCLWRALPSVDGFYLQCGQAGPQTLYPRSGQDVVQILAQARDNAASLRVTGGSFPFIPLANDLVVDLRYVDRLVGLDVYEQTVKVESGMRLARLNKVLESVSLALDVYGKVPDLTVCDAVAVGAFGGSAVLMSSLASVEVALAGGRTAVWTWEKTPTEMRALCCGLGMAAVLLTATFKCVPLQRYAEVSYLCSIRDVLDQWSLQVKSSFSQQLVWYPFSELTVVTHVNPTDKYTMAKQPLFNYWMECLGEMCARAVRKVSLLLSAARVRAGRRGDDDCGHLVPGKTYRGRGPSLVSSLLSRLQFFAMWSAAKQRSDFVHSLPRSWHPREACRGSVWLVPLDRLPEVLGGVSRWARENPRACVAPIQVQTIKMERRMAKRPFLAPFKDAPSCSVWLDWFVPDTEPDPIALAYFEDIFHSAGGRRAWTAGERLTSPLVLADAYERYPHWCRAKARLDPEGRLQSAYVQGTVWSEAGYSVDFNASTLSLCSSVMDTLDED